jgi:hypothetical protein
MFLVLNFYSCATNYEEEKNIILNKHEHKDLVSSFEIAKEEAANFKEVDPVAAPTIVKEEKAVIEVKKSKTKIAKVKKSPKIPNVPVVEKNIKSEEVLKNIIYPKDFPEDFKKYDNNSKNVWAKFKPIYNSGEQSIMAISYLGVTAGYITIISKGVVKLGDRLAYHYFARFKSKEAYRYFYWLDDYLETFIDKENFTPIKYSLVQREKKQNVDDLQLFDLKKLKNYTWYKRVKEGSNKDEKKDVFIPYYLQDSFSALQFVRGMPLNKGDMFEFPVTTRAETWILKVEVVGEETISVNDIDTKAIKIKAETHFPGVLQKSGDIIFWYAADEGRHLLKFQAKVKLGSIYGDLVEYKPGTPLK